MEALPKMPMISPEFRISTLNLDDPRYDFVLKLKEYILIHFEADPHIYNDAIAKFVELKNKVNKVDYSDSSVSDVKKYYGQLLMMQKRFPMSSGQDLEVAFSWKDSICDKSSTEVAISDIEFEKASILFNIGTVYAQIAAREHRDDEESLKRAFGYFQTATGAFEKLRVENYGDTFYPAVDLDPQIISCYERILLAQAQECLVQKSLLDNRSPIVIAKLSKWLFDHYTQVASDIEDWNLNIPDRTHRKLLLQHYQFCCLYKADVYATIAYLSMGDSHEKENNKKGYRLAFYNLALKHTEKLNSKISDKYPEFMATIIFLSDVVLAKQKNAEKENNFIYHDRVPKEDELINEMKDNFAMCKAKPTFFDPLDISISGEDLFGSLLPPGVLKSVSVYEEKKAQIRRDIRQELNTAGEELNVFLHKTGYVDLKFLLTEGKDITKIYALPDMLLERNADLTANPDAVPSLLERLREVLDTSRVAEAQLNTLMAKLRGITLHNITSDDGFKMISNELDKKFKSLSEEKAKITQLNKTLAAQSANLQILSSPLHEIREKLMPAQLKQSSSMTKSKEEIEIKRLMDKIEEMQNQRCVLYNQLDAEMKKDDISKELLSKRDFSHEDIYEREIRKHDSTLRLIRMNIGAQEKILHAFTEANADFCDERLKLSKNTDCFNADVMNLVVAYDVYKDVENNLAESERFFKSLKVRCDQFAVPIHMMEQQCDADRIAKEKSQLEARTRFDAIRQHREAREMMNEFSGSVNTPSLISNTHDGVLQPTPQSHSSYPRLGDVISSYRNRKAGRTNIHHDGPPQESNTTSQQYVAPPSPTPSSVCDFPAIHSRGTMHQEHGPSNYFSHPQSHSFNAPPSLNHQDSKHTNMMQSQYTAASVVYPQQQMSSTCGQSRYQQPSNSSVAGQSLVASPQNCQHKPEFVPNPTLSGHSMGNSIERNSFAHLLPQGQLVGPHSPAATSITSFMPPQPANQAPPLTNNFKNSHHSSAYKPLHGYPTAYTQFQGTNYNQYPLNLNHFTASQSEPNCLPDEHGMPIYHQKQSETSQNTKIQPRTGIPMTDFPTKTQSFQNPGLSTTIESSSPSFPTQSFVPNQKPELNFSNNQMKHINLPPNTQTRPINVNMYQNQEKPVQPELFPRLSTPQHFPTKSPCETPILAADESTFNKTQLTYHQIGGNSQSPWHITPSNLQSPWHSRVLPQVLPHQRNQLPQQQNPMVPVASHVTTLVPSQSVSITSTTPSNVDILSTLLGEFNMPPTLEPTYNMVNQSQGFSLPKQPDQMVTRDTDRTMMDQPAVLNPIHYQNNQQVTALSHNNYEQRQNQSQNVMNIPTYQNHQGPAAQNTNLSVIDVLDPSKFEIGTGNPVKLEKRQMHDSIRRQQPPPPMNPNDPINQINPYADRQH